MTEGGEVTPPVNYKCRNRNYCGSRSISDPLFNFRLVIIYNFQIKNRIHTSGICVCANWGVQNQPRHPSTPPCLAWLVWQAPREWSNPWLPRQFSLLHLPHYDGSFCLARCVKARFFPLSSSCCSPLIWATPNRIFTASTKVAPFIRREPPRTHEWQPDCLQESPSPRPSQKYVTRRRGWSDTGVAMVSETCSHRPPLCANFHFIPSLKERIVPSSSGTPTSWIFMEHRDRGVTRQMQKLANCRPERSIQRSQDSHWQPLML